MNRSLSRWAMAALVASGAALAQQPRAGVSPNPTANPAGTPAADKPAEKAAEPKKPFADVPPIQPFPRPGWFAVPPADAGYYRLSDHIHGEESEKPPKYPYPRFGLMQNSFFDIDWRYLDDPKNTEHDFFDCLKRQKWCDDVMFTAGGEVRYRYNDEGNSRVFNGTPANLRGVDNVYSLTRVRLYGDLWLSENFRIFAEYIDAQSFEQTLPPLAIDRNWGDLLNAFIDIRTFEIDEKPVWVRVGRQELLYGSQRLVSPLEWANTRRTFQGVKAFWQGDNLSADAFITNPIIPNNREFDWADQDQVFSGLWFTYRPDKTRAMDFYALNLDRGNNSQFGRPQGSQPVPAGAMNGNGLAGGGNVTTLGTRFVGASPEGWLWDVEGMFQFGSYSNQSMCAQAATVAGGYHWKDLAMKPTFWVSYDYASGDPTPNQGGTRRTFDQLFPFGHYYFGYIDVVGRRNINDLSLSATLYPTNYWTVTTQLHNFYLDREQDALYDARGNPVRQDRTGRSGRFVGQEVDFLTNFHLDNHQDILISYSYLFAGEFLRNTASDPRGRQNPTALYLQYTYRF